MSVFSSILNSRKKQHWARKRRAAYIIVTSRPGCNVWRNFRRGSSVSRAGKGRRALPGKARAEKALRAGRKALNLDGFVRMLFFEGLGHVGKVLEFGTQVQPMVAADGRFEGRLNFSPLGQSGC
jgi:hypothetical protein